MPSYPIEPASGGDYGSYGYDAPAQPTTQWQAAGGSPTPYPATPQSGPPYSGPPYSGPPLTAGPPPTSGMPAYGQPVGPPPPRPKRGVAVPILSVLSVLLLIGLGVMIALYVNKNGHYRDAKQTVVARDSTISDRDSKISSLEKDLQKVKDDLETTKRDLSGSQNLTDELKRQKQVIRNCIDLSVKAAQARRSGNTAQANALDAQAETVCDEAFKYLSS